jgi:hypothetical protein
VTLDLPPYSDGVWEQNVQGIFGPERNEVIRGCTKLDKGTFTMYFEDDQTKEGEAGTES